MRHIDMDTHQALLCSGLGGAADVNAEGFLSEGSGGKQNGEHLVELQGVANLRAACAEQAASGLRTGQHYHPNIPADRNEVVRVTYVSQPRVGDCLPGD